jgi:hypothetical protein
MSKSTNRRKSIAIALAVLGVAGLSLASAAQLGLQGTASVQSGILAVNADCQPQASKITVSFAAPTLTTTAGITSYASAAVKLAGIDSTAAGCLNKNYKLALLDVNGALVATIDAEVTGQISATNATPLTLAIPAGQDNNIKTVALTIYS